MNLIPAENHPNPNIYFSLREDHEYIIVDSEKVCLKLLQSSLEVTEVLATPEFYSNNQVSMSDPRLNNSRLYVASRNFMENITGFNLHHGVMAIAKKPTFESLEVLADRIVVLNGVTSPENVGSIVRSSLAFNVNSLIFDAKSASPYLRRAIRVSMGNIFKMKIFKSFNLSDDLEFLSGSGYHIHATANNSGALDLETYKFPKKSVLLIGSEGHGIDDELYPMCHKTLKIPINDDVMALNASCAASVFLYALSRYPN